MKYDDASWHYGSDNFPANTPDAYGGTHIGLFLKWTFLQGWASDFHLEEWPEAVKAVTQGLLSGTDFLFKYCDGKFTDEDLNESGNAFASQYYDDDGLYLEDYANHFGEQMYVTSEDAHDFKKFSTVLDTRLKSGILTTKQAL